MSRIEGAEGHIAASFLREDGTWTDAAVLDLGAVRFPVCPYVSPDGKYLFVLTGADIYWVDAQIIEEAKRLALGEQ